MSAPGVLEAIADHHGLAVDLFFTLSGFLITLLLLRELARTRTLSIRGFYVRRTLRLGPGYLVFALVTFGLTCAGFAHVAGREWLAVLTYTVNFLPRKTSWEIWHLWSFSIQEQFYLLWPPLLLLLRPKRAQWAVIAFLLSSLALRLTIYAHRPAQLDEIEYWTPVRADGIAAGCLLALLVADPISCARMRLPGRKAFWLGTLVLGGLVAANTLRDHSSLFDDVLGCSINAAGLSSLIWLCADHGQSFVGRVLQSRPLAGLGTVAYSLYLWQQLFLNHRSLRWVCHWPVNLCCVLLVALPSYWLLEAPALRRKERTIRPAEAKELPCQADRGRESSHVLPASRVAEVVEREQPTVSV